MTAFTFPDTNPASPETVMGKWLESQRERPEPRETVREAEIKKSTIKKELLR